MTKVLVTGASGFIGRETLPLLVAAGFEVHALSRGEAPSGLPGQVQWHRVDLMNR